MHYHIRFFNYHFNNNFNYIWINACILLILLVANPLVTTLADPISNAKQIETARKELETDTSLNDTDRKKASDLYEQALSGLKEIQKIQAQLTALDTQIENAPKRLVQIRATLKQLEQTSSSNNTTASIFHPRLSLSQIELRITNDTLILNQQKEMLRQREEELANLLVGAKGFTEDIALKTKVLTQLDQDLAAPPNAEEPLAVQQARILALKIRRQIRSIEIELLKKRLGNSILTDLAQNERDLLVAQIAQNEFQLSVLKQQEQILRQAKATAARQQAEAQAQQAHQDLLPKAAQAIANSNARFHQELEQLIIQEQQVDNKLQLVTQGLDELKTNFDRTRQRVEAIGLSPAIGRMLRQRYSELPALRDYYRASQERTIQISKATDRQLEIDELLQQIPAIQQTLEAVLTTSDNTEPNIEATTKVDPKNTLIETRRSSLHELQKIYSRYISKLVSLDMAVREYLAIAKNYRKYIDAQLLWIPNINIVAIVDSNSIVDLWSAINKHWRIALNDLKVALHYWLLYILFIVIMLLAALSYQRKMPKHLQAINLKIRKIRTDSFYLSLQALFFTILLAIPIPLTIIANGYLLQQFPAAQPFTLSIAEGLLRLGLFLAGLKLVQVLCQDEGFGERHLRWSESINKTLLGVIHWFIPVGAGLNFLIAATASYELPTIIQLIGVVAFVVLMLILALIAKYLLHTNRTITSDIINQKTANWIKQLHFIWFPLAIGIPIALAILSIIGFHYTAMHLEQRLQLTLWYFLGILLIRDLILRWLFIADRRLRYENALRRREEQKLQQAKEDISSEKDANLLMLEIPEVNYASLGEQSKSLVYVGFLFAVIMGFWEIWKDLIPSLGFINTALPFATTQVVDGIAKEIPVTVGDLIISIFTLFVTILAAKNLPGLLEISLLQRLPIDTGTRYAVTTLSQYLIVACGILITFSNLGLKWSNIQWLIAALGLGLGFGLQEIVANFISGIILLFERPIRIGDVVTIDNITGVVSRIHIRATIITNFDMLDLIVPNKEFITGRLVNWSLTNNAMNRITIRVGIAYGSDAHKAIALLAQIAAANEHVLKDPKPLIIFDSFGDNTLNLIMHCYLENLDNKFSTITALHLAINDQFKAVGINIAFPQRDLHLVNTVPLQVHLKT